jgi:type IV pilus assembly protein PilE
MRSPLVVARRPLVGDFCKYRILFINIGHDPKGKGAVSMNSQNGFTLLEMMIVVAIISILAGIAVPAYNNYVLRGQLTEAYAQLAAQRVRMEQYYQDMRTYTGADAPGTVATCPAPGQHFNFNCAVDPDGQGYTITANGLGFTFTIDANNNRATTAVPAGWTLPATACWVRKKEGVC